MGIKERRAKFQDKKSLVNKPSSGKAKTFGKSKPFNRAGSKDQKKDTKVFQKKNDGKFRQKRQFPEPKEEEDPSTESVKNEVTVKTEEKVESKTESTRLYKVSISGLKNPSFSALRELTKKNNIVTEEFEINEETVTIAYKAKKHALKACNVLCGLDYKGSSIHASLVGDDDAKKARRTRLIIRNLPWSCTEEKLKNVFHKFGAVTEVKIPLKADGKMRGFGFVQFTHGHESAKAVKGVKEIDNRRVAVDWCIPREDYQAESKESTEEVAEEPEEKEAVDEKDDESEDESNEEKVAPIGTMSSSEEDDSSEEEEEEEEVKEESSHKKKPTEEKRKKVEIDTSDVTEGRSVFLRNLPFDASQEDLEELVKPYGKAVKVSIVKNEVGVSKGVAFVEFASKDEADRLDPHASRWVNQYYLGWL